MTQAILPFPETNSSPASFKLVRSEPTTKGARSAPRGPFQHSLDLKPPFIEERIAEFAAALTHLKCQVENRTCLTEYEEQSIANAITAIVMQSPEQIRFVPRRLHPYLDQHFISYFDKRFGHDPLL